METCDLDPDCVCKGEGINRESFDTKDTTEQKNGKHNQTVQTHRRVLIYETRE